MKYMSEVIVTYLQIAIFSVVLAYLLMSCPTIPSYTNTVAFFRQLFEDPLNHINVFHLQEELDSFLIEMNSDMDITTTCKFNSRSSQLCNLRSEARVDGGMGGSNVKVHREKLTL